MYSPNTPVLISCIPPISNRQNSRGKALYIGGPHSKNRDIKNPEDQDQQQCNKRNARHQKSANKDSGERRRRKIENPIKSEFYQSVQRILRDPCRARIAFVSDADLT